MSTPKHIKYRGARYVRAQDDASALRKDIAQALSESVGKLAKATGTTFDDVDLENLQDVLDEAPFKAWETFVGTYIRDTLLTKMAEKSQSAFEDRFFKAIDNVHGLKGEEAAFWDELEELMKGRPFGDIYEVAPDLMDEFYERSRAE